jgi:hypothetical protein
VYARTIKTAENEETTLTLQVGGKLWNRSLVMRDLETESEWSHILGEAMAGKLKGTLLDTIPSDMVTWESWKKEHPDTTVINLSRTNRSFLKEFYADPTRFVLGFRGSLHTHHCSYQTMADKPLQNVKAGDLPLVITFNKKTTSALIFSRKVGEQTLIFEIANDETLRDVQTKSIWNRSSGQAIEGPLKGKTLEHHIGIPSFLRAWNTFHPKSVEIGK